ncbi:hypothetical protein [Iningainema tapete]|nr:hypothetical protein [Iningainema tapete]
MLKSIKNGISAQEPKLVPTAICITFSSVAAVMGTSQSASAQLNLGNHGVQPGLESEYLQYQLSGSDLSKMRSIPACDVGFGLSCNKTGTVLQELVEKNNGSSYRDLLLRAAGGQENYDKFANFYGNNPNLPQVPYASFWQNDSTHIMDGYQYLLGQTLSRNPVEGLGLVTKNFSWAPLSGTNDALSLRSGLVNLKLSYGRLLLEEVAKIPNIEQQIQSLDLSPKMKEFYQQTLSQGIEALNKGDETQLQQSIFHVLSHPYTLEGGEWGRPIIGIGKELTALVGEGLPGESFLASPLALLEGDAIAIDLPAGIGGDVFVTEGEDFPGWLAGGPLALLLLLFLNGDNSSLPVPVANIIGDIAPNIVGGGGDSGVPDTVGSKPPGNEVQSVPEPSTVKSLFLLVITLCMLSYQQRHKLAKVQAIQFGD